MRKKERKERRKKKDSTWLHLLYKPHGGAVWPHSFAHFQHVNTQTRATVIIIRVIKHKHRNINNKYKNLIQIKWWCSFKNKQKNKTKTTLVLVSGIRCIRGIVIWMLWFGPISLFLDHFVWKMLFQLKLFWFKVK